MSDRTEHRQFSQRTNSEKVSSSELFVGFPFWRRSEHWSANEGNREDCNSFDLLRRVPKRTSKLSFMKEGSESDRRDSMLYRRGKNPLNNWPEFIQHDVWRSQSVDAISRYSTALCIVNFLIGLGWYVISRQSMYRDSVESSHPSIPKVNRSLVVPWSPSLKKFAIAHAVRPPRGRKNVSGLLCHIVIFYWLFDLLWNISTFDKNPINSPIPSQKHIFYWLFLSWWWGLKSFFCSSSITNGNSITRDMRQMRF
jgi:hypothetical protein